VEKGGGGYKCIKGIKEGKKVDKGQRYKGSNFPLNMSGPFRLVYRPMCV
jgi:hypothetical protein